MPKCFVGCKNDFSAGFCFDLPPLNEFRGKIVSQQASSHILLFCFVALRPKSTAMVMAGRSVNLTTLFPGQA